MGKEPEEITHKHAELGEDWEDIVEDYLLSSIDGDLTIDGDTMHGKDQSQDLWRQGQKG